MPFDAFSAVQAFADGSDGRAISDVLAELNTQQLSDLRVQVEAQLNHMPKKGDPLRAQRLQQLRDLLRSSVRGMIVSLAASMAMEKATGYTPSAFETRPETANVPTTSPANKENIVHPVRPAISAFAPVEKSPAAAAALPAEKPALSYEEFKKMADPANTNNMFKNMFGYLTYRAARIVASSSAKDSWLGKMFKKFGWDKSATALTAMMELGANAPTATPQTAAAQATSGTIVSPPSVLSAPAALNPQVVQPPVVGVQQPASVLPANPAPAVPPNPAPVPAPTPAVPVGPEKKSEIPSDITFDQFKAGVNILDTRVQVTNNTITVGTKKWELVKKTNMNVTPFGGPLFVNTPVLFSNVEWQNDMLTITASLPNGPLKTTLEKNGFPTGDTEKMPRAAALEMLNHLKTQSIETDIKRKVKDVKTRKEKEEVVASLVLSTK